MPPRQRVADIPVGGEASPSASGLPAAPPSDTRLNFSPAADDPALTASRPSLAGPSGRRASVGAADGPKDRRKSASQRPSWSCTECTRRKIRCDRIVPGCNQCIKRNKVHLCRLDQDVEIGFDLGLSNSSSPTGERRLATVEEYEAITRQANALRLRLYHLERAVQAFIPPSGSSLGGPARPLSSPASRASGLPQPVDENARGATFSEPTFAAPGESVFSGSGNDDEEYEGNNSFQLPPLPVQQPSFLPSSASSVLVPPSLAAPPQPQDDEVEAAVSLEFLALGRDSKSTHLHRSELRRSSSDEQDQHLLSASPHKDSAASVHATDASIPAQLASGQPSSPLPDIATSQNLIAYSLDHVKWQHAAVHSGQFSAECAQFYEWGETREKSVNPAWLALYYAMLCVGVKHLTPSEATERGYSPEGQKMLAKRWFDASVDALHRANFLAKHSLYSLQTITLFAVSCQDVGGSDLIATLLAAGIRIAQHMSLHRMGSDEDWEAKRRRKGIKPESELGAKLLIEREIRKRLWYGLLTEDWISMHFRRAFAVSPLHFDTPVPLNCHDSDLSTGRLVNRPQDEPSDVTKTILLYHVASCMRRYFDHINQTKEMSQANLIEADKALRRIILDGPFFLRAEGGNLDGMPRWVGAMRSYWIMSISHKLLVVHRMFIGPSLRDARYVPSRRVTTEAARSLLVELGRRATSDFQTYWTLPYHTTSAATTLLYDLFHSSPDDPEIPFKRREVHIAVAELQKLAPTSHIAARGVSLLTTLLAEEAKQHPLVGAFDPSTGGQHGSDGAESASDTERPQRFDSIARHVASTSDTSGVPLPSSSLPNSSFSALPPHPSATELVQPSTLSQPAFEAFLQGLGGATESLVPFFSTTDGDVGDFNADAMVDAGDVDFWGLLNPDGGESGIGGDELGEYDSLLGNSGGWSSWMP